MPSKFSPDDLARIGGKHRPCPSYYPWLRAGRVVKIQGVVGRTVGGHLLYGIYSVRAGDYTMPSYDLRHPNEPFRPRGATRGHKRILGICDRLCPNCHGTGLVDDETCTYCDGERRIPNSKE